MGKIQIFVDNQEVELDELSLMSIDAKNISEDNWHIIHKNQSIKAELQSISLNERMVLLKVNGKIYRCKIGSNIDELISKINFTKKDSNAEKIVLSPMAGLMIDIHVEVGQVVSKGSKLLSLEAMKMENVIKSNVDGEIEEIFVVKGSKVEKSQLLIKFK
ncbi:MAG: acetyl-CoA carboxylase biotin carboxyl carrier protein subunit [Saprospiraceae bacterium]|nr:acetyl-CoA carboxylase biotin carboxyl carrier protein subunit [Saprospiraceae bacterium]